MADFTPGGRGSFFRQLVQTAPRPSTPLHYRYVRLLERYYIGVVTGSTAKYSNEWSVGPLDLAVASRLHRGCIAVDQAIVGAMLGL